MLIVLLPLPLVGGTVWQGEDSVAFPHSVDEPSRVCASICVPHFALSLHLVVEPGTCVLTSVWPLEGTLALHLVLFELTCVDSAISEDVPAAAFFRTVHEVAFVLRAV